MDKNPYNTPPEKCQDCGEDIPSPGDIIDLRNGVRRCYHLKCFIESGGNDNPKSQEVNEEDCF